MRIAVVDDHPFVVDAISTLLPRVPGAPAVDAFGTLEEFEQARSADGGFILVLLDLGLPGYSGLAALQVCRDRYSDLPVVVLSGTSDRETILGALDLGAMGFIPKSSTREVLIRALELVLAGGVYIPPEALLQGSVRTAVAMSRADLNPGGPLPHRPPGSAYAVTLNRLTRRQRDVLDLLIMGLPNKLICRRLELSPNTVKSHVSAIFRVLNVVNRTEAVIAAQRLGVRVDYAGRAA